MNKFQMSVTVSNRDEALFYTMSNDEVKLIKSGKVEPDTYPRFIMIAEDIDEGNRVTIRAAMSMLLAYNEISRDGNRVWELNDKYRLKDTNVSLSILACVTVAEIKDNPTDAAERLKWMKPEKTHKQYFQRLNQLNGLRVVMSTIERHGPDKVVVVATDEFVKSYSIMLLMLKQFCQDGGVELYCDKMFWFQPS